MPHLESNESSPVEERRVELTPDMFPVGTWEKDGVIFSVAPTWEMNDRLKFSDFVDDLERKPHAKRDYGCMATAADESYLPNPELIEIKSNRNREDPWDVEKRVFKEWFKPKQKEYYVGLDLSVRHDSSGLCMAHWDNTGAYGNTDDNDKIVVDFMIDLPVPEGGELSLRRSRQIVYELKMKGFSIVKVTLDGWMGEESLQEFERHDIPAERFSVDSDTKAYDTLVDLIDNDKIDYYYHPKFIQNMKDLRLVNKGKKVDHCKDGAKDLSDAVCSCVYACAMNRNEFAFWVAGTTKQSPMDNPLTLSADGLVPYGYYKGRRVGGY